MYDLKLSCFILHGLIGAWALFNSSLNARAQDSPHEDVVSAATVLADEGPNAALTFEKGFREEHQGWKPVPLDECHNIRQLTEELWSKKHVLTDFKQSRSEGQVGAIVIVKTEFCCEDSRLCAVTTACMEKRSTPLIGRFRVYAGWVKNQPNHETGNYIQWDQDVINEYGFTQGPGARIVVMIPTFDGKMYQWFSSAADLELSLSDFEGNNGRTPKLEQFLAEALKYAPGEPPRVEPADNE